MTQETLSLPKRGRHQGVGRGIHRGVSDEQDDEQDPKDNLQALTERSEGHVGLRCKFEICLRYSTKLSKVHSLPRAYEEISAHARLASNILVEKLSDLTRYLCIRLSPVRSTNPSRHPVEEAQRSHSPH